MSRIDVDLTLGQRYRLLRRIATGGMGSVWEAEDSVLHRSVAVKVLLEGLAADERFLERFRREARAAAGLSHPNVASVYDYGEEGGTPYIVMELIRGETLAERLRREGALPAGEAVRITEGVTAALQAAHDAGVVHRDVKPGNVMLTSAGEVKVLDFGIAAASWATPITATGAAIGTATYISPEQASGLPSTPASDVYSLGVVLYEMLAGRPPFIGESPIAVASSHVSDPPPPLGEIAPGVPESLAAVTMQALAKDPAERPPSAAAMAGMLRAPQSVTQEIPPVEEGRTEVLPRRTGGPGRRRRVAWVPLAVLAALALAAVLIVIAVRGDGTPAPSGSPSSRSSPPAARTVPVPSVIGLTPEDATRLLERSGLQAGPTMSAPGEPGKVVRTDPQVGAQLTPGSSVTLFVGAKEHHGKKDGKGN